MGINFPRIISVAISCAAAAAAMPGHAADAQIRVEGAWARRAAMMASADAKTGTGNGAVYATLINKGAAADALIAAESGAAAAVEIHETYRDMGMMMMRPVAKIDVPAGKQVEMKPGGYHIMLLGLKGDLKPGQTVNMTLRFQNAGRIQVKAEIK